MSKESRTAFRHFDLPVNHLGRHGHYIPPKARDEAEIARRRELPTGTLLAEKQAAGTAIAARALSYLAQNEDSDFLPDLIAASGINTAWHTHAQHATDVMRRRLWLPVQASAGYEIRRESLLVDSAIGFNESAVIGGLLAKSIELRSAAIPGFKKKYARRIGNMSLVLACVPMAERIAMQPDEYGQQFYTRQAALKALDNARNLEEYVGANPTMAQLADHDSPMSVYIRRNGTNVSVEALEFASSSEVSSR